jgi:ATP-dependent Clp protease protease subunit
MKPFFTMKSAGNGEGEILIYDQIGEGFFGDGMSAKAFDAELKNLGDVKSLNVRINSPGGSVFDGLAIYNTLKNHSARKTVTVDGIAASAASLIAMAGDEIVMPDNAFMLIHEPRALAQGTATDMLTVAADLEKMTESFAGIYAGRSGSDADAAKKLMGEDRLMTAAEAKACGYADKVTSAVKMTAAYDLTLLPEAARKAVADAIAALGEEDEAAKRALAEKSAAEAKAKGDAEKAIADAVTNASATAREEITQVLALCGSQKIDASMALEFVTAKTPIAEVREKIAAHKAVAVDALLTNPVPTKTVENAGWDAVAAKVNKEFGLQPK